MPQFTKEHLDKALDRHFKKIDQRFEKLVTKQDFARTVQTLATRDDLDQRTEELKAYTDERFTELKAYTNEKTDTLSTQIEALARMVQEGFEDLQQRLDVREQVARHDRDIRAIKQALHLSK